MAILIRYTPTSLTRDQYDQVNETLRGQNAEGPPSELHVHVLFGDEPGLRVSEVWDSEEAWRSWYDGPLGAALRDAGVELEEPEILPVQELWGSKYTD